MKISAELIKTLMKAIRQQERMDGALKWSPNRALFMGLIEDNEYESTLSNSLINSHMSSNYFNHLILYSENRVN